MWGFSKAGEWTGSNSHFGCKDLTGFHCCRNFDVNGDQNLSGLVTFRTVGGQDLQDCQDYFVLTFF
jgi:hypothetical protein